MREIEVQKITDTLAEMCIEANCKLNGDIMSALKKGRENEENSLAEDILGNIIKNAEIAADEVQFLSTRSDDAREESSDFDGLTSIDEDLPF